LQIKNVKYPIIAPNVLLKMSSISNMPVLVIYCKISINKVIPKPIGIVKYVFFDLFK